MSEHNENYVGGDIAAGARHHAPAARAADPAAGTRTPSAATGVYLCSASTPPGPGVHGLGGWFAAKRVLRASSGSRGAVEPGAGGGSVERVQVRRLRVHRAVKRAAPRVASTRAMATSGAR